MLVGATLLIQDVQLICFTIVFGVLALQRWSDRMRRWLWYSFLANTAGAALDLFGAHLPTWLSNGVNGEMIPLSYALLNVALVYFDRRGKTPAWISGILLLPALPVFMLWRNMPVRVRSNALGDLLIALVCIVTVCLLWCRTDKPTRAPRVLMGGFLAVFVIVELARVYVAFVWHGDPDVSTPQLAIVSAVTYIVNISLLPLAFIWMMQARTESDLLHQTIVDSLTGVLNRRGLEEALKRELALCHRYGEDLTLAMIDLDHFKRVNDKYGHAAGDEVLANVAQFLIDRLRETDVVGRYGGEEFVLILSHASLGRARPILEQICHALRQRITLLASDEVRVTASFGVASVAGRTDLIASDLLGEADAALYQAKEKGRDQVCFFSKELRS